MLLGLCSVGNVVQIRPDRIACSCHGVPHLLLRFESNRFVTAQAGSTIYLSPL